jgi:hypothetical protein
MAENFEMGCDRLLNPKVELKSSLKSDCGSTHMGNFNQVSLPERTS